jgi:hypothetical protein
VVDRYGYLAELCYFGTEPVETANLTMMTGLHSSFLNGLVRRGEAELAGHFDAGFPGQCMITFFREDWAAALGEKSFADLVRSLREALQDDAALQALWGDLQSVLAGAGSGDKEVDDIVDGACAATVAGGVGVGGSVLPSATRKTVEKEIVAFLASTR